MAAITLYAILAPTSWQPSVGPINEKEILGVGIIITGECSDIAGGTCGSINHKGIRIEGW